MGVGGLVKSRRGLQTILISVRKWKLSELFWIVQVVQALRRVNVLRTAAYPIIQNTWENFCKFDAMKHFQVRARVEGGGWRGVNFIWNHWNIEECYVCSISISNVWLLFPVARGLSIQTEKSAYHSLTQFWFHIVSNPHLDQIFLRSSRYLYRLEPAYKTGRKVGR